MSRLLLRSRRSATPRSAQASGVTDQACGSQTSKPCAMYEWIKALHVIAVISWMAGMLYLPRLFVYHCEAEIGSKQNETVKTMEWRVVEVMINPALMGAWTAGLYLAWSGHWFKAGWFDVKLLLVLLLSGIHGYLARWTRDFRLDRNR